CWRHPNYHPSRAIPLTTLIAILHFQISLYLPGSVYELCTLNIDFSASILAANLSYTACHQAGPTVRMYGIVSPSVALVRFWPLTTNRRTCEPECVELVDR